MAFFYLQQLRVREVLRPGGVWYSTMASSRRSCCRLDSQLWLSFTCSNYVLEKSSGLEEFGTVQWHLAVALVVAWILIFLCLMKGIKSVGKVVYVTALLPYVLLTVFLVKGLTLPGAMDGILFFIKPDFTRLLNGQVRRFISVAIDSIFLFPLLN